MGPPNRPIGRRPATSGVKGKTSMPTVQIPVELSLADLVAAAKQLPGEQLRELARQIQEWDESDRSDDLRLVEAVRCGLESSQRRRLEELIERSEDGTLTPEEITEYQALAQAAERIDVTRLQAAQELSRRWRKPLKAVLQELSTGQEVGSV